MIKYITFFFLIFSAISIYASALDTLSVKDTETAIIDSILISGNDITEEFIILRELTFAPGDTVDGKTLNYNRERIYSLGIFNFVKFRLVKDLMFTKLLIEVDETWYIFPVPFINIRENKLSKSSYGLSLYWKNFRGRNEELKAAVSLGYDPSYFLSYYNPVLIEKSDISFGLDFAYTKFQNKSVTAKNVYGDDFDYKTYLTYLTIGKRINLYNNIYGYAGMRHIEAPFDSIKNITASGNLVENFPVVCLGYVYDTRDLAQFARNGTSISGLLFYKGFGIDNISYSVLEFDFRKYNSIAGDFSAKFRLAYRHTFGRVVPYYDYSVLGFDEYVRGHREDDRDGNGYILTSLEVNYPILKEWNFSIKLPLIPRRLTSTRISIYLSAFGDTGTTYFNNKSISANDFYSGYGFGVTLLFLPYNAFRFEYAFDEYRNGEFIFGTGFSF